MSGAGWSALTPIRVQLETLVQAIASVTNGTNSLTAALSGDVQAVSGAQTLTLTNPRTLVVATGSSYTVSLPTASASNAGWDVVFHNNGSAAITFNGVSVPNTGTDWARFTSNGSAWFRTG